MITFDQVTKTYGTGETVLDNLTFHINPGELVVVTGPSGSGKTTLLRLIYRDLEPTKGSIKIDDKEITRLSQKSIPFLRRRIGFAFQDFKIIPDRTVWENIALTLDILDLEEKAIAQRVKHLLDLVGLPTKAKLFPGQLSGGELQRVSIARAIAHEPDILLADEPTGNLDLDTSLKIADLLEQINSFGTTVILATHDPDMIKRLKARRISLKDGAIEHDTDPQKPGHKKPKHKKEKPTDKPDPDADNSTQEESPKEKEEK